MKIAHESPIDIFSVIQPRTDYDYALVHLFEESQQYWDIFIDAKQKGREIILDNSLFELGEAFSADRFIPWVEKLAPTWYIIPDVFGNAELTIRSAKDWAFKHPHSKSIGVVQGSTYDEMVWCYKEVSPLVDKVAISFGYPMFDTFITGPQCPTIHHQRMHGRISLIQRMVADGVIDESKPHHLLGCSLPQEFAAYRRYDWLDSLDTSNPVVAGIEGMVYDGHFGLQTKPRHKLFTLIDDITQPGAVDKMCYNIECFRKIVKG